LFLPVSRDIRCRV